MERQEMTPEQQLAFDGFIDIMVQIYKMTSDEERFRQFARTL